MKKIYVLGDSISIQYGPYLERYLQGIMAYARKTAEEEVPLDLDWPPRANGGDSSMVLAFLKAKAAAGGIAADFLLLNCGLWDLRSDPRTGRKQVPLASYRANLEALIALVREIGPELVWIRTTPCDEAVHNREGMAFHRFAADCDAYNRAADEIMRDYGVPIIDLHTFTRNLGDEIYADHVHFKEHVREKQGAFIAGWLSSRL
ncbi:MAG: SGNH/GDSL hydrolase family protein [Anaerolineae bacterium]